MKLLVHVCFLPCPSFSPIVIIKGMASKVVKRARLDYRITPWTASRSNQSILKETNPEHPLEGLMLKVKLQHFGHLM